LLGWLLLVASLLMSYFSRWWLLVAVAAALPKIHRWILYSGAPWRRMHYTLMHTFAGTAGLESGRAEREGRDYDINLALAELVRRAHPDWTPSDVFNFLNRETQRRASFADRPLMEAEFRRRNRQLDEDALKELLDGAGESMRNPDNATMRTMAIAGLIEQTHGEQERAVYLVEVLSGHAR
jgi:hypothetical protein